MAKRELIKTLSDGTKMYVVKEKGKNVFELVIPFDSKWLKAPPNGKEIIRKELGDVSIVWRPTRDELCGIVAFEEAIRQWVEQNP